MFSILTSFLLVSLITQAATTISTNINTQGTLTVSGTSNLNGALYASSTLQSTGATRFYSTARIDGATTLNGVSYTWPSSDGSSSQYLQTNGAGTLAWATISSGSSPDWVKQTNYGVLNLTASTTIPYWAKDAIYASSTLIVQGLTTLGNASTTQLTNSGLSWFNNLATFTTASTTGSVTIGDAQADILTINAGTINYINNSTSTIAQNVNSWSLATSTTARPIFTINGSAGNVGIATTSPSSGLLSIENTGTGYTFYATDSANDSTPFVIDASGNVGVGKKPNAPFQIESSDTEKIRLSGTSQSESLNQYASISFSEIGENSLTLATYYNGNTNAIIFSPKNVEAMRLLGSGRVGIGTTTPTTMFQVATSTTNATTTIEVGKANQNKGSCLKMYDDAGAVKYVSINGTSFVISATSCE